MSVSCNFLLIIFVPYGVRCSTGGDTTEFWAALQMVLMLEGVEYRLK